MSGRRATVADLAQKVRDAVESGESDRLQAKIDTLKKELGAARKHAADEHRGREAAEKIAQFSKRDLNPPKWLTRSTKKTERVATLCTVLSDTHFDEVVDPSELDGRNAYNREIAEQRLERYFTGVVKLARHYLAGVTYDGAVLFLGGDLISGDIHEELSESNEGTAFETVLHWSERIAAGVSILADEFSQVHIPLVVGNHGRRTRKPRAKKRARDNFDWLIGQMIARHFQGDARVTFQIPDGTDALVPVHDMNFLLTHGDQVGGGGGIGGIWPPIMRMVAKKRTRYDFDSLVCGHWHQLIMAPSSGLIVNGSLKGYDEYASISNFVPERAQQALWTVAPGAGVTFSAPVFTDSRKEEGW